MSSALSGPKDWILRYIKTTFFTFTLSSVYIKDDFPRVCSGYASPRVSSLRL